MAPRLPQRRRCLRLRRAGAAAAAAAGREVGPRARPGVVIPARLRPAMAPAERAAAAAVHLLLRRSLAEGRAAAMGLSRRAGAAAPAAAAAAWGKVHHAAF